MNFLTSASWKTTSAGIGTILVALGTIGTMLKTGAFDANVLVLAFTNILTGAGLILAKDKNVVGSPPADVAK